MNSLRIVYRVLLTSTLAVVASAAAAQTAAPAQPAPKPAAPQTAPARPPAQTTPFEPKVGQQGKDVVWVPTPQTLVDKMLDMAKVTKADYLIDLGSGDGRTVITAAKRGVRAHGIEYNPDMVALSQQKAREEGVASLATFEKADLFESDFSKASVITMFLLSDINLKLRPKLLDLKPGTRIVSNTFTMGDWEADETTKVEGECVSWCSALMWIIPAKVQGTWRVGSDTLTLNQTFQMVSGKLGAQPITNGKLNGDTITFSVGDVRYTGTVAANTIKGTRSAGAAWTAQKQ
jgi:hypothetical protein